VHRPDVGGQGTLSPERLRASRTIPIPRPAHSMKQTRQTFPRSHRRQFPIRHRFGLLVLFVHLDHLGHLDPAESLWNEMLTVLM
jgi:hypothetical protein